MWVELIYVYLWNAFSCQAFLDLGMRYGTFALLMVVMLAIGKSGKDAKCRENWNAIHFHEPCPATT
jgi:hypothetical protein